MRQVHIHPHYHRMQNEPNHYYNCNDDTFEATTTCPDQPYLHTKYCKNDKPPPLITETKATPDANITPPPPTATKPPAKPTGPHMCMRNHNYPQKLICTGDKDCTNDWHYVRPPNHCITDTQYFYSCTNETFIASMTYPKHPHHHHDSYLPEEETQ